MNHRVAAAMLLACATLLAGCRRSPATPSSTTDTTPAAAATPPASDPSPTQIALASPAATPTPAPTPGPRIVDGLQIVDEVWNAVVRERGGLRIRSAPRVEPGNVIGSVAEGTPITVEGRVLNGQEAEAGKGATWLIVGPSQYIYAPPGYVERVR